MAVWIKIKNTCYSPFDPMSNEYDYFCGNCGRKNRQPTPFCPKCGEKMVRIIKGDDN